MKEGCENQIGSIRVILFIGFICIISGGILYSRFVTETSGKNEKTATVIRARYSEFPHSKHEFVCNTCHKFPSPNWQTVARSGDPFPDITDYPRHESCLNCHRRQFFGSGPKPVICSICHTNPSPRDSSRHPFPNPRELFDLSAKGKTAVSDFAISFPHDKHIEIVSENQNPFKKDRDSRALFVNVRLKRAGEESCKVCHQTYKPQGESTDEYFTAPPKNLGDGFWLKKGTFKSVQIGHTVCFTCHSTDTGILPAPDSCGTCHKLKPKDPIVDFDAKAASKMNITDKIALTAWRRRDSSATFRHEFSSHTDLECANCHNVNTLNTLDAQTKKVNVLSCAPCHITATSDDGGILNFEVDSRKKDLKFQCAKCHIAFGQLAIPASHNKAIAAQSGN